MKERTLSVIIPNYNGVKLLKKNLPSVQRAIQNSKVEYEIIVVDDASTDASVDFITSSYPEIKLIKRTVNGGFSAACNDGIDAAVFNYVLLLNSDIELPPDFLNGQFNYFEMPDTFGVTAKIIGVKGEIQDTARLFSRNGFKIKADKFFHVKNPVQPIPTAYLSGANALIDAEKLRAAGKFDEIFSPFYYEDFELGLRAWRLGWICYYHPHTYCIHDHSSTTKNYKTTNWVKSIFFRNRFMMHSIHLEGMEKILWQMQVFSEVSFKWLTGKLFLLKAHKLFVYKKPEIRKSRKKLQQMMKKRQSSLSVNDVIAKINSMLEGIKVIGGRK